MGYKSLASIAHNKDLIVFDNSVVMHWFFNDGSEEDLRYATDVLQHSKYRHATLVVPSLWLSESSFVSNFYVKRKMVESSIVTKKLTEAFNLFSIVECHFSALELFEFSAEFNLSSYDANYALLAKKLNCPLSTLDKKLRKAVIESGGLVLEA